VGACFALVGILFILAHFAVFNAVFSNPQMWINQKQPPPPPELFAMMKWFYLIIGSACAASAAINVISGIGLLTRRFRMFSLAVAGFNCLHIPLGTVLGTFTIIVLLRDSVCEMYEAAAAGPETGQMEVR
jgi:hypothetical protein